MQKSFKQILGLLFFVGFVLGVIYENVIHIGGNAQDTFGQADIVREIAEKNFFSATYFVYILRLRLQMLLPVFLIALMKSKKMIINLFLLWVGFLFGVFFTNAIIWAGIAGVLLGITLLLPHIPFYVYGYYLIFWYYYRWPEMRWDIRKTAVCIVVFLVGIMLEAYANPWLVKSVLKMMK